MGAETKYDFNQSVLVIAYLFLFTVIYCDYTASGRPLQFIENFIKSHVLPL